MKISQMLLFYVNNKNIKNLKFVLFEYFISLK